jgi:hypothetical protein
MQLEASLNKPRINKKEINRCVELLEMSPP